MSNLEVKVTISEETSPSVYFPICSTVQLITDIIGEIREPLDIPDPDADAFSKMLCTYKIKIEKVRKSREEISYKISKAITNEIMRCLESNDTFMGYKEKL